LISNSNGPGGAPGNRKHGDVVAIRGGKLGAWTRGKFPESLTAAGSLPAADTPTEFDNIKMKMHN
jgi:hypothetical protein